MENNENTPVLVPIEEKAFWLQIRLIVRQELSESKINGHNSENHFEASGLKHKPIYDMKELRKLFNDVSRTTIYAWIKVGKLRPKKMKGKVYFLWIDIERILNESV